MSVHVEWMDASNTVAELADRGEELGEGTVECGHALVLVGDDIVVIEGDNEALLRVGARITKALRSLQDYQAAHETYRAACEAHRVAVTAEISRVTLDALPTAAALVILGDDHIGGWAVNLHRINNSNGTELAFANELENLLSPLLYELAELRDEYRGDYTFDIVSTPVETRTLPEHLQSRFTDEERARYEAGVCGWVTEFGMPWTRYCEAPADLTSELGYCTNHEAETTP